jgi:hypothetical protein
MRKLVAALVASAALVAPSVAIANIDRRVMKVVKLTRETRENFIVISDVYANFENLGSQNFVGGEFHSGVFHRIEDQNNRVVANCQSRTGFQLWIPNAKISTGPDIADGACGIGYFSEDAAAEYLGHVKSKFGRATRVRITFNGFVRTYDVLANGAIMRNTWRRNDASKTIVYKSEVRKFCAKALPESAFGRGSLKQSFLQGAC